MAKEDINKRIADLRKKQSLLQSIGKKALSIRAQIKKSVDQKKGSSLLDTLRKQ